MTSVKISIIIPTKNRPQDLDRCLESISEQTLLPDEIIVVDASTKTEASLGTHPKEPKVKFIRSEPGLTHQKNVGVEASSGDIVFFLDDDVVLDKDFVKEIIQVFNHDEEGKVAGVCGKIVIPINNRNLSPRSILSEVLNTMGKTVAVIFLLRKPGDGTFRVSGFPNYPFVADEVKRVEFLSGGLTAWRRKVLIEFEFDEKLPGPSVCEDDDFSYRVSRKYDNVYTPYARVIHYWSPAARDKRCTIAKITMQTRYYLFRKNLPRTFMHRAAYYWSVIGMFLQTLLTMDAESLKGFFAGLVSIVLHSDEFGKT